MTASNIEETATAKKALIVYNPISGIGRGKFFGPVLADELNERGWHVELHETMAARDATRIVRDAGKTDRIIFCGGDGTFHEVVCALDGTGTTPIVGIPSGTGNAYAKELNLPWFLEELVDYIEGGKTVYWDLCQERTSGKNFILFAGAGFQSMVIKEFDAKRTGTVLISDYITSGVHVVKRLGVPRVTVEVDGRVVEDRATWVDVFNISHYGGPIQIAPQAKPDDGLLDVMVFTGKKTRDIMRLLVSSFFTYTSGKLVDSHGIRLFRGKRVRITSTSPIPFHLDGNVEGITPCEFVVTDRKIPVLAPVE